MIELERLCKRYGAVVAVADLSLEVARGELLVLLGGSGSRQDDDAQDGEPADRARRAAASGSTARDTRELGAARAAPPHRLLLPAGRALPAPHGRRERRDHAAAARLGARRASRARVDELLALVELDPARFRERRPSAALGRAAAARRASRARSPREPAVVLLDEPFGALDPLTRDRLQQLVPRASAAGSASPRSSSRTTWSRRSCSATASRCSTRAPRAGRHAAPSCSRAPADDYVRRADRARRAARPRALDALLAPRGRTP